MNSMHEVRRIFPTLRLITLAQGCRVFQRSPPHFPESNEVTNSASLNLALVIKNRRPTILFFLRVFIWTTLF